MTVFMMMRKELKNMKTINVLGTEYKIIIEEFKNSDTDGYCDYTNKEIHLRSDNVNEVGDFEYLKSKQLRHEIIHAFLAESGLQSNFQHFTEFGHEETMVDWIAIQWHKINEVFRQLKI